MSGAAAFHTLRLTEKGLELLDQRVLPHETRYLLLQSGEEVARAIEDMVVRGAPAIGDAAAMGVAVELARAPDGSLGATLGSSCARLRRTRPTAVNLDWALTRVERELAAKIEAGVSDAEVRAAARELAQAICDQDLATCHAIGDAGAALVPERARIQIEKTNLTLHCRPSSPFQSLNQNPAKMARFFEVST